MLTAKDQTRLEASVAYMHDDVGPIPQRVAQALPCFAWDMERLRACEAPTCELDVDDLRPFLEAPIWRRAGDLPFTLSPAEVALHPELHRAHYEQAMTTDLGFPVEIICLAEGRRLADGYHRLLKANVLGEPTIRARLIPESAIPSILADLTTLARPRGGRVKA